MCRKNPVLGEAVRRFCPLAGLLLLLSSGCVSMPLKGGIPSADREVQSVVKTELYFGTTRPEGPVTDEEWQSFLDGYITPRFEYGLMVLTGHSQYWPRTGDFVQETMRVVVLVREDSPESDAAVEYIRRCYRELFEQDYVVRIDTPVRMSLMDRAAKGRERELGVLQDEAIHESSGLAFSTRGGRVVWTHNDSGDVPRIFAVGLQGEALGTFAVDGAEAVDWEDIASARVDGRSVLVLADIGDNKKQRETCDLYIVSEPDLPMGQTSLPVLRRVRFRYEDGPHNAESMGVDDRDDTVYLVSKNWGWRCAVYAFELPDDDRVVVARKVAQLRLPLATALDFSPDRTRAVVLTYGDAYEYRRAEGQTWAEAFGGVPRMVPMPRREQGESICYGPDGVTLYVTSEKLPAPLWEVVTPSE